MQRILNFLDGKKSILGFVAGAVYSVLIATGVVPSDEVVWGLIVAFTGISFRLAINKV